MPLVEFNRDKTEVKIDGVRYEAQIQHGEHRGLCVGCDMDVERIEGRVTSGCRLMDIRTGLHNCGSDQRPDRRSIRWVMVIAPAPRLDRPGARLLDL